MRRNPVWILVLTLLTAFVPLHAQQTEPGRYARGAGTWPNFGIYKPAAVAPVDLADSPRIDRLVREGKLHLSLADAVALALENNLDIAVARYGPLEADAEILRTRGGGVTQGINTAVGAASTGQSAAGPGGGSQVTGLSGSAFTAAGAGTVGGGGGGVANLDPVFTSSIGWNHFTNPQSSDFVAGTSSIVFDRNQQQMGYSQGFLTGTSFQLGFTNTGSENNIDRNNFNPSLNSSLSLSVTQRLTQGFGRSLNSINISVAKNNREVSDLAFKEQVMTTVNSVVGLYWDLVGFSAQVEARRRDLELSENLLRDNKRKVELGLLAGIEVMRSEAQVASSRNALTQAIRTFREQEVVLKNALSKHGPSGSSFSGVEVNPTDRIVIPEVEPIEPLQDLVGLALQSRPNLVQSRINLTNSDLQLKGVRNGMLPSLDLVGTATNNALAGTVNPDLANIPGVGQPNPFFVGGFGTALGTDLPPQLPRLRRSIATSYPA